MKKKKNVIVLMTVVCSLIMGATCSEFLNVFVSNDALAERELNKSIWERYDYTLENGTPAVNCYEGGCSDCLIKRK